MRLVWRPDIVGQHLYSRHDSSYNYGYANDAPRLFREGDRDVYYPTEYLNIRAFSLHHIKAPNERRIFTLGGSVSRGSGLREGADYSSGLERMLNELHPEFLWRVVNLSADGVGSARMYRLLSNAVAYAPDALIVHPHGSNEYEDERDAVDRQQLHRGINGLVLRSRLLVLLKKAYSILLPVDTKTTWQPEDEERAGANPENVRRWLTTLEQNTERMDCVASTLRVPAIYVGRAERDGVRFRNERVEQLNAPIRKKRWFVDTAAVLAKASANHPGNLFLDNTHFTESGHEILARRMYALLRPGGPGFAAAGQDHLQRVPLRPLDVSHCDLPNPAR